MLHERGVECVDITDSARGRASMSMMAVSTMIRQQVGMEVIIHFSTRDRSLLGIQAELLGAYAMGHRIILALTGDPPNPVEKIASSGVFDIDSIGLIKLLRRMNQGLGRGRQHHRRGHRLPHRLRVRPQRPRPDRTRSTGSTRRWRRAPTSS